MASVTVVAKGALLEGRVVSDGEVIVEEGAEVRAEIRARRVVIRGVVRGDVVAIDVRIEGGGKLIGALKTPAAEAAVQVAETARRPAAQRNPLSPQMADELAESIALDATREIADDLQMDQDPLPSGLEPPPPPEPASSEGPRRMVAVRRKP